MDETSFLNVSVALLSLLIFISGTSANGTDLFMLIPSYGALVAPIREIRSTTSIRCLVQCAGNPNCYGSEISSGSWRENNVTCRLFDRRIIIPGSLQLQEGVTYHKRLMHKRHKGILRHVGGLCVGYNPDVDKIELNANCNERFEMVNNRIYKQGSMQCLVPSSSTMGSIVVLSTNCEDPISELIYSRDGLNDFYHPETTYCIHQQGGYPNPAPGTSLVTYFSCGEDKLKFYWED